VTTISKTTMPLYQRLIDLAGTDEVFSTVAGRLYDRILGPTDGHPDLDGDLYLVAFFRDANGVLVDRDRLQQHMTVFLAAALGGPQRYTGREMTAAHAGRQITDDAFDRVVGHLVAVLEGLQVPAEWIEEIGAVVAPLRESIVTARPASSADQATASADQPTTSAE
jgi:truncated hemoglobin YjbI